VHVRPAEAADIDAIRAIAQSYDTLHAWPHRPDFLDYELAESALWVAVDSDRVAGFAGVLERGGVAHLADLFVDRDRLGQGIGRRLLAASLPSDAVRTTFASSDPRAMPLYVRAGLVPIAPLLYLSGDTGAVSRLSAEPDASRVDMAEVIAADARATGRERGRDLRFLSDVGSFALVRPDAYAVVRPVDGAALFSPVAGSAHDIVSFIAAAGVDHAEVRVALFGPHPAVPALVRAGFRIRATDTYMASRLDALDCRRYGPSPEFG
jgi:GNAT superfamily N-acetyltransferase